MPALEKFLTAASIGTEVGQITGVPGDIATAGGYAAWVESVTGKPPLIERLDNKRARIYLDDEQIKSMRKWLDSMVAGALQKKEEQPRVHYDIGPVLTPWAIRTGLPIGVGLFVAGWIVHWYFAK